MKDLKIDQVGGTYQQIWQLDASELLQKGNERDIAIIWLEFDLDEVAHDWAPHPEEMYYSEDCKISLEARYKIDLLQDIRTMNLFDFMCEKWSRYVKISANSKLAKEWIKELANDYHNNPLNVRTNPIRHVVLDRCDPDLFSEKLKMEKVLDMFGIDDLIQNC